MVPKKFMKAVIYLIIISMVLSTLVMGVGFFY
jgi:hypothetical protein